jgi:hypothetical protein
VVRDSSSTGTIWFDGTVALGETFVIDPATTFGTNTWVQISSTSGTVLQTITFHTSCSQPLRPGDMYGSLRLEGCIGTENGCPTAMDDSYNALNNTPLVVPGPGVLGNDKDPEGDKIAIVSYTQPGNGTVTLNPDGSFTYTPITDYCGMDSFTYKITDGVCDEGYQDEANVSINVRCLSCKVTGSSALTFSGRQVSWQITNGGADPLAISSIYLMWPTLNKKEVKVMLDGVEIYSPDLLPPSATINSGWKGTVAARTIGPGETSTLTFEFETTASINQSAYRIGVQSDVGCSVDFVPPPYYPNLCGFCWSKPIALAMKYIGATCTANCNSQAAGKVIVTGDPAGATPVRIVAYDAATPTRIWHDGMVSLNGNFVIDGTNGGATSMGTNTGVKIYSTSGTLLQTIIFHTSCSQPLKQNDQYGSLVLVGCAAPVNDCPAAVDDTYNGLKNTPLKVTAPGVLGNDADTEGNPISVASYSQPAHGTVVLNTNGSFTYTPNADYCGADSFTYKATDGSCNAASQDEASVSIDVKCKPCEGSNALTFSGRQVSWQISNYAANPISISRISLAWPAANKKEMKVMLGGVEIYSPDLAPPSATINSGWKGTVAARSIGPGKTSTLTFEFETTASTNQNGYTISVQLNPGCSLNFVPGP